MSERNKNKMISCKLKGRLGNQLFQYAVTIAYSIKYNVPYCIPAKTERPKEWKAYQIGNVKYAPELSHFHKAWIYTEPSLKYTEIPELNFDTVLLDGMFQSYKYFDSYIEQIRNIFNFPQNPIDAVAIHVRRGDYLKFPNDYPVVSNDYIYKAINELRQKGHAKFKVFSDGMDWCKENINAQIPQCEGCTFEYSEGKNEIEDFTEILNCKHQIISNSTFSYWGAMLNNNPEKIIICPHEDNFYGKKKKYINVETLYPDSWIRIKY